MDQKELDAFIAELNKNGPGISKEDYAKAEAEINARMEEFDQDCRAYFAMSRESASHAYPTF